MNIPVRKTFLVMVTTNNNNKFYTMTPQGTSFLAEWGRVGRNTQSAIYPISKWESKYNEKVRKGYADHTDLMAQTVVDRVDSGNQAFENFYDMISHYTGQVSERNYSIGSASAMQISEAQVLIDKLIRARNTTEFNRTLLEIFQIIPREMGNVNDYLLKDMKNLSKVVMREQDALDSMDSVSFIKSTANPYKDLGIACFEEVDANDLRDKINKTIGAYHQGYKIHKVYKVYNSERQKAFDKMLSKKKDKTTELLFHGTRNANVCSIMKTGLLIRPSNAIITGAANGNGVYHSRHTAKSLNYTGQDSDAIFFIQNVHLGNTYTYNGWRSRWKDEFDLTLDELSRRGYDSCSVKADGRLLNSEYIVYDHNQTVTNFIVHFRK